MRAKWILEIAKQTLNEWSRERVLWVSLVVGVVAVFGSILGALLDPSHSVRLFSSWGYAAFRFSALGLGAVLGASVIAREAERRTVQLLLSRGIGWDQIVFGKALGIGGLLFGSAVLLLGSLGSALVFWGGDPNSLLVVAQGVTLGMGEAFLLASFSLFFAAWMKAPLALASSLAVWLAGHQHGWVAHLRTRLTLESGGEDLSGGVLSFFLKALQLLPRFDLLVVEHSVNHSIPVPIRDFLGPMAYALFLSVVLIFLSGGILKMRGAPE